MSNKVQAKRARDSWKDPVIRAKRVLALKRAWRKNRNKYLARFKSAEYREKLKQGRVKAKLTIAKKRKHWQTVRGRRSISQYMKINNPMFKPECLAKSKATLKQYWREHYNEIVQKCVYSKLTPEQMLRLKERKRLRELRITNPEAYKKEIARRISIGKKKSWSNPEVYSRTVASLQRSWDTCDHTERTKSFRTAKFHRMKSKVMRRINLSLKRPAGPQKHLYQNSVEKIWMRSREEVLYAQYLDSKNIPWLYESCTFQVGQRRGWTPDFYLPTQRKFVEIKGWFLSQVKRKINRAIKHFAHTKFELIRSSEIPALVQKKVA